MRALLVVIVLAIMGWGGWWYYASQTAMGFAKEAIAAARDRGWQLDISDLKVAGFPNRIDLTASEPTISPPDRAFTWSAPFLQAFSLSYKPWHLVTVMPPNQTLTLGDDTFSLTAKDLRSSLILTPNSDLALDRFQIVGKDLNLRGTHHAEIESLSFATRPSIDRQLSHDIGLEIANMKVSHMLLVRLPEGIVRDPVHRMHLDAAMTFDRPLDRHALQVEPKLTNILIRKYELVWDTMTLNVTGELSADAKGFAAGSLALELQGKTQGLAILRALEILEPYQMRLVESAVAAIAPGEAPLKMTLTFSEGAVKFGPIPLGPAPRLN